MRPKRLTRRELLTHLRDIVQGVDTGDTLEGNISWGLPEDDDPDGWDVMGAYRVGNLMGQGGMVLIGEPGVHQMFGKTITGAHNMIMVRTDQPFERVIPAGILASVTLFETEADGARQSDS